jgi:chemotaxis response regulator CheB
LATTVLLADHSGVMRAAIIELLNEEPWTELVGEASTFAETVELAAALDPDVVLLDLQMGDQSASLAQFNKVRLAPCIIAFSVRNDEEAHSLAASFGARVCLDKSELRKKLIPMIKGYCSDAAKTA